jgi:hypothetical protein
LHFLTTGLPGQEQPTTIHSAANAVQNCLELVLAELVTDLNALVHQWLQDGGSDTGSRRSGMAGRGAYQLRALLDDLVSVRIE